ncbi:MAG TPA: transglycosylase SLT domain-containing protein, partial [Candidatus Binataceae bacterium]
MKTTPVIIAAAAFAICFASARCVRAGSCDSASRAERRAQLGPIIDAAALVHGLDPSLLYAIARVESGECADAVSHKGAAGLMQLMPDTASRFGVEDPFDPAQNALGAARL